MNIDQLLLDYLAATDEDKALVFYQETNQSLNFNPEACELRKYLKQLLASDNYLEIIKTIVETEVKVHELPEKTQSVLLKLHLSSLIVSKVSMSEAAQQIKTVCMDIVSGMPEELQSENKLLIDRALTYMLSQNLEPDLVRDLDINSAVLDLYTPESVNSGKIKYTKIVNLQLIN